jgi:hypothetical protein
MISSAQACSSSDAVNPFTISAVYLRNAFHTLTRAQLAHVLYSGCPDYFAKSSEASPSAIEVLDYNILWLYLSVIIELKKFLIFTMLARHTKSRVRLEFNKVTRREAHLSL